MSVLVVAVSLVALLLSNSALEGQADGTANDYHCAFCTTAVNRAVTSPQNNWNTLRDACEEQFSKQECDLVKNYAPTAADADLVRNKLRTPRSLCEEQQICSDLGTEMWRKNRIPDALDTLDIRVSKAYGARGYDQVRISVIANNTIESDVFSYSQPFKFRWTTNVLNTGVVTVTPGVKTTFKIAGVDVDILVPTQGSGTVGLIFADPCISSEWIYCMYNKNFDMFNTLTDIINAATTHDDVSYWQILGDNFYDQDGFNSGTFFSHLSKKAKSTVFGTQPGNHDFWVKSSPNVYEPGRDQLGNGFMQFYGQDVAASVGNAAIPYDFSVNPDTDMGSHTANAENLPVADNFFYYNQVGNVGFIGYSGAHTYEEMQPRFEEACNWAAATAGVDVLLLQGHWNGLGTGCAAGMDVPELYKTIAALPACKPVASKMRYFLGHQHCNHVIETDVGFMVGGFGMSDKNCGGDLGMPVVDTRNGLFKVYYFPLKAAAPSPVMDNYEAVKACFEANGVTGCYHLAVEWASVAIV